MTGEPEFAGPNKGNWAILASRLHFYVAFNRAPGVSAKDRQSRWLIRQTQQIRAKNFWARQRPWETAQKFLRRKWAQPANDARLVPEIDQRNAASALGSRF